MRGNHAEPPANGQGGNQPICMFLVGMMALSLTGIEIVSPFAVFIIVSKILTEMDIALIFDSLTYYRNILSVSRVFCIMLPVIFALQYYYTFNKKVHYARHSANVLFIIFCFMITNCVTKSDENKFRIELAKTWDTSLKARMFEKKFSCDGLSFNNVTKSTFCDHQINLEIKEVFGQAGYVGTWNFLYISVISMYSLFAFIIARVGAMSPA